MPRTGKCPNYAGCLLAYRNETITVPDGAPYVCPECQQPLTGSGASGKKPVMIPMLILGGISLLVIMGSVAVYIRVLHYKEKPAPGQIGTSFEQAAVAAQNGDIFSTRHGGEAPADSPAPAATAGLPDSSPADAAVVPTQTPNLSLQDKQNQAVKNEVTQRIDLMPTITSEDKDKLYMSVQRARQMGKILTIPFPSGHATLSSGDIDQLKAALASQQLQPLLKDPTCVLVVLGFADIKGDEKTNLHISAQRATSVLNTLRDKCAVLNVLHSVGMGGSTLFGNEKDAERNRVVEVWAVLP